MSTFSPKSICFVGLGAMGYPMASLLHKAGVVLEVFDASSETVSRFVKEHPGVTALAHINEVSPGVGAVVLMLPDSDVVDKVVLGSPGSKGLADRLEKNALVIDMSSSNPVRTRALAQRLDILGIKLIDAPVSGGVKKAVTGSLAIMVGGNSEDIDRAQDILNCLGASVTRVGAVGCGHALKALNNYIAATGFIAACEALIVAKKFGIDLSLMTDVLNQSSGKNSATDYKVKQFILNEAFNSGFSLQLMAKDVGIAANLAESMELDTSLLNQMSSLWADAAKSFDRSVDHTLMYKLIADKT
jgi:3-hydroxyisobutyrate dehydrogenase